MSVLGGHIEVSTVRQGVGTLATVHALRRWFEIVRVAAGNRSSSEGHGDQMS
jgi:hypothetical protein